MENLINEKLKMIKDGFDLSQIRTEVWNHLLRHNSTLMRLDSIILLSMEVYAEIVKRAGI
jgi:hypothetical protein